MIIDHYTAASSKFFGVLFLVIMLIFFMIHFA